MDIVEISVGYSLCPIWKSKVLVTQSRPPLCDPMDSSSPGFSVHGILQARILYWVAIPFSRGPFQPKDRTWVSCIGRQILYSLSHLRFPPRGLQEKDVAHVASRLEKSS